MTKHCGKCETTKPLAEFNKKKAKKDGHASNCRECAKAVNAAYRAVNKDRLSATQAAWYAANKARKAATNAAWNAANKEHHLANKAAYRAANKARKAALDAAWQKANPEKHAANKARKAAWRAASKERHAVNGAAWRKANSEIMAEYEHRRRARKAANGINLVTAAETAAIIAQPCMAMNCGAPPPSTVEHLIPISRGGAHTIGNLAPLCGSCNSSKHDMLWIEWKHRRAVLAWAV